MRANDLLDSIQLERRLQLQLLNLRKKICDYSIGLGCELYNLSSEDAQALRDVDTVDVNSSISNLNIFTLVSDPEYNLTDLIDSTSCDKTREEKLAILININSKD